jgi:hypothetical protein
VAQILYAKVGEAGVYREGKAQPDYFMKAQSPE